MGVREAEKQATVPLYLLPEKKHFHLLQKGTDLLLRLKLYFKKQNGKTNNNKKKKRKSLFLPLHNPKQSSLRQKLALEIYYVVGLLTAGF